MEIVNREAIIDFSDTGSVRSVSTSSTLTDAIVACKRKVAIQESQKNCVRADLLGSKEYETLSTKEQLAELSKRSFIVVHFGTYYDSRHVVLPGEVYIAKFSVFHGIQRDFCYLIDGGKPPLGLARDAMLGAQRNGYLPVDYLDADAQIRQREYVATYIKDYLDREMLRMDLEQPPAIYVMEEDAYVINECLIWLMNKTGVKLEYKIRFLHTLAEVLLTEADHLRSMMRDERFPLFGDQDNAEEILREIEFRDNFECACAHHQEPIASYKYHFCAAVKAKAWIYSLLKYACPHFNSKMLVGSHCPEPAPPLPKAQVIMTLVSPPTQEELNKMDPDTRQQVQARLTELAEMENADRRRQLKQQESLTTANATPDLNNRKESFDVSQQQLSVTGSETSDNKKDPINIFPGWRNKPYVPLAARPLKKIEPLPALPAKNLPFGQGYGCGIGIGRGRRLGPIPEDIEAPVWSSPATPTKEHKIPFPKTVGGGDSDSDSWKAKDNHSTDDEYFETASVFTPSATPIMPKFRLRSKEAEYSSASSTRPHSPSHSGTPLSSTYTDFEKKLTMQCDSGAASPGIIKGRGKESVTDSSQTDF